jgi:murein L,D-transpeptidase YafK
LAYADWPAGDPPDELANHILVLKSRRKLTLFHNSRPLKTYEISLGRNPIGPKQQAGDHRTPEGDYVIDWRNPKSNFHLSLHISYPNAQDSRRAHDQNMDPGGDIMIHGIQNGLGWIGRFHRWVDWTDGCIAVTDAEMDQVWRAVPDGTPIEIRP